MRRPFLVATAAAAALLVAPTAAAADSHLGSLQVVTEAVSVPTDGVEVVAVHGVPDEVFAALGVDSSEVDVLVNGDVAFSFSYGETLVVDSLEAGTEYTIEVAPAGGDPILDLGPVTLEDGTSTSVVAHLTDAGDPALTAFENETDATGIQVFHAANFGPVDIVVGDDRPVEGAANGDTAALPVGAGSFEGVGVAPAGDDVAIDLGTVDVPEDTLVLAYAVGQLADDAGDDATDDDATEDDDAAEGDATEDDDAAEGDDDRQAPTAVDSGQAGLASDTLPLWVVTLMGLGLLAIAAPTVAAVRRR